MPIKQHQLGLKVEKKFTDSGEPVHGNNYQHGMRRDYEANKMKDNLIYK